MVAGLFAKHGVWVGTHWPGDDANAKGHFENVRLKRLIKGTVGPVVHRGVVADPIPGWKAQVLNEIERDGYREGPWLFKGSAMYWRLWGEFDPRWVCVRRRIDSILASGEATGFFTGPAPGAVEAHVEAMDTVRDDHGGVDVDADAVVAGDYSTLECALASVGIEMNEGVVGDFVDPSLWRFG